VTGLSASTTYFFRVKALKTSFPDSGYSVAASQATLAAGGATVALTAFAQDRVFALGAGMATAPIAIAGTYTGAPGDIRWRLWDVTANAVVAGFDFDVLVAAPSGNAFSVLKQLPAGGPYRVDLRIGASGTIVEGGTFFLCGLLIAVAGSQNMFNLSTGSGPAHAQVKEFASGWAAPAGVGMVALANRLRELVNMPVGIIARARNAQTKAADWPQASVTAFLTDLFARVSAAAAQTGFANGDINALIIGIGEQDAVDGTSATVFQASLTQMISDVRTRYGRSAAQLPLLLNMAGRSEADLGGTGVAMNWNIIREAQRGLAGSNNIQLSHAAIDLSMASALAYDSAGLAEHGRRFARGIAKAFGLVANDAQGPLIVAVSFSGVDVFVDFSLNGATDIIVPASATGFEVLTEEATPQALAIVAGSFLRTSASRATFKLTAAPPPGIGIRLYHNRGADPVVSNPIRGNMVA
jgi:Carbohydrate esterase, sialic acid-specific acetylesterase